MIFKATKVEDVEMIYSILRERYPKNEIDITFNYNTKEYKMKVTDKPFTKDPDVEIDLNIQVVYGDSVFKTEPVLLRDPSTGKIDIKTIESICDSWKEYPEFKIFDKSIRLEKQYGETHYEVWSDRGWTPIRKVIRHKTDKKIYKILTHGGCVKVTEDHSLLTDKCEIIKPNKCNTDTLLLTAYPDIETTFNQTVFKESSFEETLFDMKKMTGADKFCINAKGSLDAAKLYYFGIKRGYYVSINEHSSDVYTLMFSFNQIIKNDNQIKKIVELPKSDDFVYDIETECGRFGAGVGNIIVKNTDSVFLRFKYNRDDFEKNRLDTFKYAITCGDNLTKEIFKRPPIELEFEKVYQPFVLLTKKRYIGKKFEDTKDPLKLKTITTAGIAITRRDFCLMVKNCYKDVIDCIMETEDLNKSCEIYKSYVDKIRNYKVDVNDLVVSAMLAKTYSCSLCKEKSEWNRLICSKTSCKENNVAKRLANCSKCGTKFKCIHSFSLGHVNLAVKLLQRTEEISVNDRIQYLYIETGDPKAKKAEIAEDPKYAHDHNLKFNRICYLEQLAKTLLAFFKVILSDHKDLMNDLLDYTNDNMVSFGGKKFKPSDFKMDE